MNYPEYGAAVAIVCVACCVKVPRKRARVCVCVYTLVLVSSGILKAYEPNVRFAVRANRHTLLKVSQEYTQKASMPAHTQTHTQAMGFLGLQCKSAQRAPTSS